MSFDWQTEEEWDEMQAKGSVQKDAGNPYHKLAVLLLIMPVLMVGVFWLIRSSLNERVEEVDTIIREEVVSSAVLVRQAFENQDIELFAALLSGRNIEWSNLQQTLFIGGGVFERSMMGLQWQPNRGEVIDVELNPDLTEATVIMSEWYVVGVGNGVTQTVQLQHREVYRQGTTRWLLSVPDEDLGTPVTRHYEGQYLQLVYDVTEQSIVEKLALDLDRKIGELCRGDAGITCSSHFQVSIEFSHDPMIFSLMKKPTYGQESEATLLLPSPTILGMPIDQVAYEALYRGYAVPVLSYAFAKATQYVCCEHIVFHQALLDKQLAQLGVKPWPISEQNYEMLAQDEVMVRDMNQFWEYDFPNNLEEPDIWQAYIVVDFVLYENPELSIHELHQNLFVSDSYWSWLSPLVNDLDTFDQRWLAFVENQFVFNLYR